MQQTSSTNANEEEINPLKYFQLVSKGMHFAQWYWDDCDAWKIDNQNGASLLLCRLQGFSSCSGTDNWRNDAVVPKIIVKKKNCGTILQPAVEALVKAASPAFFGKGEQTVFDESIRKGLEIKAEDLQIYGFRIPEINALAPRSYELTLCLYKMHIYQPGDHFEEHMNEQHAPNHIATLILCLPSAFEGGELVKTEMKAKSSPYNPEPEWWCNSTSWLQV